MASASTTATTNITVAATAAVATTMATTATSTTTNTAATATTAATTTAATTTTTITTGSTTTAVYSSSSDISAVVAFAEIVYQLFVRVLANAESVMDESDEKIVCASTLIAFADISPSGNALTPPCSPGMISLMLVWVFYSICIVLIFQLGKHEQQWGRGGGGGWKGEEVS